jgi:thioesterase domain-containing protein
VRQGFGVAFPAAMLFAAPTIAELASLATAPGASGGIPRRHKMPEAMNVTRPTTGRSLVLLRPGQPMAPLFLIHGLGGHIASLGVLARQMSSGRPIYALQAQGLAAGERPQNRVEAMAASYIEEIRSVQPGPPYLLGGWSLGGLIAREAARQLCSAGEQVACVAMFDTHLLDTNRSRTDGDRRLVIQAIAPQVGLALRELKKLPFDEQWDRLVRHSHVVHGIEPEEIERLAVVCQAHLTAAAHYSPPPYGGRTLLFVTRQWPRGQARRWRSLCSNLHVERVSGDHYSMLRQPAVRVLAERLDTQLKNL